MSNGKVMTPVVSFTNPALKLVSAKDIFLAWLCSWDPASDAIAFLALDLVAERDSYRDALDAALAQSHLRLIVERRREQRRHEAE